MKKLSIRSFIPNLFTFISLGHAQSKLFAFLLNHSCCLQVLLGSQDYIIVDALPIGLFSQMITCSRSSILELLTEHLWGIDAQYCEYYYRQPRPKCLTINSSLNHRHFRLSSFLWNHSTCWFVEQNHATHDFRWRI